MIYHLINEDKVRRAKDILGLFTRAAKDDGEAEQKGKFASIVGQLEGEEAIRAVYQALGGLVRTQEEQVIAEQKVEKLKKNKRVAI